MNNHASVFNAIWIRPVRHSARIVRASGRLRNCTEGFLHVPSHLDFVVTPLPMEAQHRNAPLIDGAGINFAVAVLVRNHLAAAGKSDERSIHFPAFLLQRSSVTFILSADSPEVADSGHRPATAK